MDQVAQVREKIDIVAFIGEYIKVKQAGHSFKALCPFHGEKTPSFVISAERQMWHCFGCQKGGDVYTFLMEFEHLEFGEALRFLAKRAGVELINSKLDASIVSQKEKLFTLNRLAAEFYHYILLHHNAGKKALAYLLGKRGMNEKLIETFLLGCAPNVRGALVQYLTKKKGYAVQDVIDAGLARSNGRDASDFFQGRIMFPLFDHLDTIVGFSGRVFDGMDAFGPKYVNTRETTIYHKGKGFFGLQVAKQHIKKENAVLIMEGEFDVISAFKEGFANSVAIKGTALTDDQVKLLSRFAQKVILCLDQDSAGQDAIRRSIIPLEKYKMSVTVVATPEGKDPDEILQKDPVIFKKALKENLGLYDFLQTKALQTYDSTSVEGKKKIADALLPLFSHIENEIVKEHYLRKLSISLDTSYDSITKQVAKITKIEGIRRVDEKPVVQEKRSRREVVEEYLLAVLLQSVSEAKTVHRVEELLQAYPFIAPSLGKIFTRFTTWAKQQSEIQGKYFANTLPEELASSCTVLYLLPLPLFNQEKTPEKEAQKMAKELVNLFVRAQIKELREKIKELEVQGSDEEIAKLQQKMSSYIVQLDTP